MVGEESQPEEECVCAHRSRMKRDRSEASLRLSEDDGGDRNAQGESE
jgi:hypothetical protein